MCILKNNSVVDVEIVKKRTKTGVQVEDYCDGQARDNEGF